MIPGLKSNWTRSRDDALSFQSSATDRAGAIVALSRFRLALQVTILAAGGYLAIQDQITLNDDSCLNNYGKGFSSS